MKLTFEFPLRIRSVANLHELPVVRHKRAKLEREATGWGFKYAGNPGRAFVAAVKKSTAPIAVTVTRLAPGRIKDTHDNLPMAFKSVVDEVAKQLGEDDGGGRITWKYAQEKGDYGVRVVITLGCADDHDDPADTACDCALPRDQRTICTDCEAA